MSVQENATFQDFEREMGKLKVKAEENKTLYGTKYADYYEDLKPVYSYIVVDHMTVRSLYYAIDDEVLIDYTYGISQAQIALKLYESLKSFE